MHVPIYRLHHNLLNNGVKINIDKGIYALSQIHPYGSHSFRVRLDGFDTVGVHTSLYIQSSIWAMIYSWGSMK